MQVLYIVNHAFFRYNERNAMTETCRRHSPLQRDAGWCEALGRGADSTLEQLGITEPGAPDSAHFKVGSADERRWHHEGFSLSSFSRMRAFFM